MILHLSLNLPEDDSFVGIARFLGRCLLDHMGVCEEDVADIEYVIGELAENVVRHARSADHRFLIDLQYYADKVVLTVTDHGHGFSFRDVPAPGTLRAEEGGGQRVGGFGLQMVQSLADRVEFVRNDAHGASIRAEKCLHYKSPTDEVDAIQMDRAAGAEVRAELGLR